uniref:Uncharacterized protein n=1 Tax=Oryza glumipatula TaxID=40148 RepID=A0A0D9ZV27_9ORYZ
MWDPLTCGVHMSSSHLPFLIPLPLSLLSFSPRTLFTTGAAVGTAVVGRGGGVGTPPPFRRLSSCSPPAARPLAVLLATEDETHALMPP